MCVVVSTVVQCSFYRVNIKQKCLLKGFYVVYLLDELFSSAVKHSVNLFKRK